MTSPIALSPAAVRESSTPWPIPPLPGTAGDHRHWTHLQGSALALAIVEAAQKHLGVTLVVTADTPEALALEQALRFFAATASGEAALPLLTFPDWETLAYDRFSPHPDIVSQRIRTLHRLPQIQHGVLVLPARTLMQRLAPVSFLQGNSLLLKVGQRLEIERWRESLVAAGYQNTNTVYEPGEFAIRGALLDIYPMGADLPYRIDLFDQQIESLRAFNPETQRSEARIEQIELLPAHEFPWQQTARADFRSRWHELFPDTPKGADIYGDVCNGILPPGIEYYLPLFFEQTATLFDYLPDDTLLWTSARLQDSLEHYIAEVSERYEDRRHDRLRPVLPPDQLILSVDQCFGQIKRFPRISWHPQAAPKSHGSAIVSCATLSLPELALDDRVEDPAARLRAFLQQPDLRVLLSAESPGRREALIELLQRHRITPKPCDNWPQFLSDPSLTLGLTVAQLDEGLWLEQPGLAVITESQLFGQRVMQTRRRGKATSSADAADAAFRGLSELTIGAPVVHLDHGVGRYLGLQRLEIDGADNEFLTLEYADGAKLYVPVAHLHLISRYGGADDEHAPLHKLGSDRWSQAKHKALEKIRDTAVELLDIYAQRAARQGFQFNSPDMAYRQFCASFPFEETPDQQAAIEAVVADLTSDKPMDRLICGDVGFGKTEVAMRAAFIATYSGKQVAILVPTTLLAQQHYESFRDRFADTPVNIELLSRFRSNQQIQATLDKAAAGQVDIVIGTHKLLQKDIHFKSLGLVIIDEEHRFGVNQKEKLKRLRAEVDLLTLTATPIPRTLNMALGHLRDLSIIATPPARRLSVRTFVRQQEPALVKEAVLREILRGGQVYYLHNEVTSIEQTASSLRELIPEAHIGVAHGQMRERELEQIMSDFYHRRFNLLVCTTIIETGIDIPTANTILIERADKFGLAQLHQLRGRVGRSHHQAYAYLLTPPSRTLTADASKRLEAISAAQDLGAGFMLASHDLEIRGAGELLGAEQSGQIETIGFTLYMELLEEAVKAIREGRTPDASLPLQHGTEINLRIPALIPDDYLPDLHNRLLLYKRIANAANQDALQALQVEMIDRFGLLPAPAKNLINQTHLKLRAQQLGIVKIDGGQEWVRVEFAPSTVVDPLILIQLMQKNANQYRLENGSIFKFRLSKSTTDAKLSELDQFLTRLETGATGANT